MDKDNAQVLSRNKLIPSPKVAKYLKVPKLSIQNVLERSEKFSLAAGGKQVPFKRSFDVRVETDAVALYVWLEAGGTYIRNILQTCTFPFPAILVEFLPLHIVSSTN